MPEHKANETELIIDLRWEDVPDVIRLRLSPEPVVHSEFPHPLVIVDLDAADDIVEIVVHGASIVREFLEKVGKATREHVRDPEFWDIIDA